MNIALQELGGGGNVSGAPGSSVELPPPTGERGGADGQARGCGQGPEGPRSQVPGGEGVSLQAGGARPGERGWGWAVANSPVRLTWVGAPTVWQMVEYRRATLREDDAPETPVEGGASLDAVEVSQGFSLPHRPRPGRKPGIPSGFWLPWRAPCTCPHPPPLRLWPLR